MAGEWGNSSAIYALATMSFFFLLRDKTCHNISDKYANRITRIFTLRQMAFEINGHFIFTEPMDQSNNQSIHQCRQFLLKAVKSPRECIISQANEYGK